MVKLTTRHAAAPAQEPESKPGRYASGLSRVADLVYGVWAIAPASLEQIVSLYEARLRDGRLDAAAFAEIEAKLGRPMQNEAAEYTVQNGIAIQTVDGIIAPKANMFMRMSGGASAQMLAADMRAAGADRAVKGVIQLLDSPGGNVLGIPEYAQAVREVAAIKPVVTLTDGQMASAAMWVGSAGNHRYGTGPTVEVGHVGVIATHKDISKANEKEGVRVTHITAGKYKALGSPHVPLSASDISVYQESVDYCYSLFVNVLSENLGVPVQTVLDRMADARVFRGQQAIDAGLLDGFMSLDGLVEAMATDPGKFEKRMIARVKPISSPPARDSGARRSPPSSALKGSAMADNEGGGTPAVQITAESIRTAYPGVYTELLAQGARQERDRVAGIQKASLPGHEALITSLIADGTKTPTDAALAVIEAERNRTQTAANAHRNDAPKAVRPSAPPEDEGDDPDDEDATLAKKEEDADKLTAYVQKHGGSFAQAAAALGIQYRF